MATLYFNITKSARTRAGRPTLPGNYYILGMDGFTSADEVFSVALGKEHRSAVENMWLQYNDRAVVDLFTGKELKDSELVEFAQAKLTAIKWGGDRLQLGILGFPRRTSGISKKTSS